MTCSGTRLKVFRLILIAATVVRVGSSAAYAEGAAVYGAIAFSEKNGAWGMSDPFPDEQAATENALGFCSRYGAECKIVLTLQNKCAAVAMGYKNEVAWAEEGTPEEARSEAQRGCLAKSGDACELKHWYCYRPQ